MPAVAWVTVIIAVLIIAITAVGLLRVILHLTHVNKTLGGPARRGARGRRQDHHRAHGRRVGERQPRAAWRAVDGDAS